MALNMKNASATLGFIALVAFAPTTALAANFTDSAGCDAAVADSEKAIVRATLSADDLNTLVSLADQAKSACAASDFAKASKITNAISGKLKEVTSN